MSEAQESGTGTHDAGETQATPPGEGTTAATTSAPATTTAAPAPGAATEAEVTYEFQLPEGVQFADGEVDEFKAVAKELKLPKDQAQRLVDIATKREQSRADEFKATVSGWAETTQNDKELGKPENLALALKAVETFGSPELKTILNSSGLGNHPEVVRAFLKIGRAISEDKITGKGNGGEAPRSHADVLYGTPRN